MAPSQTAKQRLVSGIRSRWDHPALRLAADWSEKYLRAYRNRNHNLVTNGEAAVLEMLPPDSVRLALDVGCHAGHWTDQLLNRQPAAKVVGFEPTPDLADRLEAKYADEARFSLERAALGQVPGLATLYVQGESSVNSLVHNPAADLVDEIEVAVTTGDEFLARVGLDQIDYLKIDVEGHDLQALLGFSKALKAGAIGVVQFEYNEWNAISHSLLGDFYALLEPLGYTLGRVHPTGLEYVPYSLQIENWVGPAFVAIHESRSELIPLLRG